MADVDKLDARLQLGRLREQVREERRKALEGALALAADAHTNGESASRLEFALGRIEQLDKRRETLSRISVVEEPDLYHRGGPVSYFADVAAAAGVAVYRVSQMAATERLQRHGEFERMEASRGAIAAQRKLSAYGIQTRNASQTGQTRALSSGAGVGGEMVPPRWLVEAWASAARAACALKGLVTTLDLPPETMELHVPRFDSSAGVVPMAQENVNAPDLLSQSDAIVSHVATFAGDSIISQAMFDRGGHFSDEVLAAEFGEAYAASLAQQLMGGTGQNGQLLGLLSVPTGTVNGVPGARLVTYTDASPTPQKLAVAIAQCAGQIGDTRERPASVALMRPSRWEWFAGEAGTDTEPMIRPGTGNIPEDTGLGPYGPLSGGQGIYLDATIPTNIAGANQDTVVLVRARDILLLEDPGPRFNAMPGTTSAGEMAVVMGWHNYTAAITTRYPSGVGTVQGTGLALPAGF